MFGLCRNIKEQPELSDIRVSLTMDSTHSHHTDAASNTAPADKATEVEVEAEPMTAEYNFPVIPPDRRLSWLGWSVALGVFLVNKKVGLVFIVLLLVFGKFPTLNLKNLPGQVGKLYKKLRS